MIYDYNMQVKEKKFNPASNGNFDPERLARIILRRLQKDGSFLINGDGEEAVPQSFVIPPAEEPYLHRMPDPGERERRRALHDLALEALTVARDLRPVWRGALKTLEQFCAGHGDFRDLIIARLSMKAALSGVYIGLKAGCANAPAALAVYHACDPNLETAMRRTKSCHAQTMEFAAARAEQRGTGGNP